jgi:hypothetical protein
MTNVITFAEAAERRRPIVRASRMSSVEQEPELSARDKRRAKREERLAEVATNPNLTTTCRNQRLRLSRRDTWWEASELTDYWHARLKWDSALSFAQSRDVADANSLPKCDEGPGGRLVLVDLWRTALVSQMLTPAPDAGAVAWKRAQIRAENVRYEDVKSERIERVIADDVEFLRTHPTRRRPPQGGNAA